ncbi:MAG: sigma-70 family RNA polymerase sigma factor [Bacillota bacterium]|nr:sigma-70 family RNA polymerase sigma factor [Bacillota bacterium]
MNDIEAAALERVKMGDADAFSVIVSMYERKVYNTALHMCKNADDAMDISQEVFLKLYKAIPSFKGESSLSTYIFRVTSNMCIDYLRKNKKNKNTMSLTREDIDGDETTIEIRDTSPNPEQLAEKTEQNETLRRCIDKLPDIYREIIILREFDGLSYKEISQVTGIEEGTVKSRLLRARDNLKKLLIASGNFFDKTQSKYIDNKKEVFHNDL